MRGVRNIDGYNTRGAEAKAKGEELTRTVQTGFDKETGKQKEFALRLGDLLKKGESRANVMLMPGDVIIIPESTF